MKITVQVEVDTESVHDNELLEQLIEIVETLKKQQKGNEDCE